MFTKKPAQPQTRRQGHVKSTGGLLDKTMERPTSLSPDFSTLPPAARPIGAAPVQPSIPATPSKDMTMNKPTTPNAPPAFRPDIARVDAPRADQGRPDMSRFDMPRRPDMPMGSQGRMPDQAETKLRKLTVGPDIALAGEISACDYLVVEGTVEARVREGRHIEIAESGLFRGTVEIDEADIGGRFEGDITVRGRLRVRSSGRIDGKVQYGELEVEAGGQLEGEIRGLKKTAPVADKTVPQSGNKTRSIGVSETVAETHQATIQQPVADKV